MSDDLASSGLSRRDVLTGAIALGATMAIPSMVQAQLPGVPQSTHRSIVPDLPRSHHTSTALDDGRLLVAGGLLAGRPTSSVLLLDPASVDASVAAPMKVARARHAAVKLPDGRVMVLGGFSNRYLREVEIYDPSQDRWAVMPSLHLPRADFTASFTPNGLLLVGGTNGQYTLRISLHPL